MKIAVAAMGNTVSGHFGHCEDFLIFDTADGAITGEERKGQFTQESLMYLATGGSAAV